MSDNNYSELFKQVELKKAPELVFEELRDQILGGMYKPGDKIPSERTLMNQFERSHPTIREALRRLESAGYIEVIPGGGAVVTEYSSRQLATPFVESLKHMRVPVEGVVEFIYAADPLVAGIAASNCTHGQVEVLGELLDEVEMSIASKDLLSLQEQISRVHMCIAEMTGNRLIEIVWKCLFTFVSFENKDNISELSEELVVHHRKLYEAIRAGAVNAAIKQCGDCYDIISDYIERNADIVIREASESVRPRKASEAIYEQIKDLIYSGEIKAGDRLPPERQLVNAFGKSRAAVREALKRLEQQGYITITRGSGSVVNNFSTDELVRVLGSMIDANLVSADDIFELRAISETIGAEWAAARRTDEDIERIRLTINDWDIRSVRSELIDKGSDFTNAVSLASHNDTVYIISRITSELMHNRYSDADVERGAEDHQVIYEEHLKILKEIEKGNIRGARTATEMHLETVKSRVLV